MKKVNFIRISRKTERKFWQKHFENFGFLGTKFCATYEVIHHNASIFVDFAL